MERIYLDSAATTSLDPEVLEAMLPYFNGKYGNPSAIHSYGRETRMGIEAARKTVAKILGCTPGEIFFTSCGTESTNTAINAAIRDLGVKHIITSAIEHPATLYTTKEAEKNGRVTRSEVNMLPSGHLDLAHLEQLLAGNEGPTLVSLMHANNEVGNLLDVAAVSALCAKYNAFFHCDMVQTIGHYPINLKELGVHFASSSGHKFHGPKGTGILFVNDTIRINPMLTGGSQERNMRAGTENIAGIVGYAKALEKSINNYEADSTYINGLKHYMKDELKKAVPGVMFNGDVDGKSLYTVLSVSFPKSDKTEMLLMNLDMAGICVSGGSACSSGADKGSHVMRALHKEAGENLIPIRFSFSKHNTKAEIDSVINKLKELL